MTSNTLAIIGSGNMGASLIGGLIADNFPSQQIWVADPDLEKLKQLEQQFSVRITQDNLAAVKAADIVILAVKPQVMAEVALQLREIVQTNKPLIISIAAGIREASLQTWLGGNVAIVRTMPNTPALIGCGATALFANALVNSTQRNAAEAMLRAVGVIVWLKDENLMDVVTALSGSGPAYFFLVMEILQVQAENLGLTKDVARLLTLQTAFGAARMALESNEPIAMLRKRVTSPGGTTEHALRVLEEANLSRIIADALLAAKQRSEELAKILSPSES